MNTDEAEEFITVWQRAKSREEVTEKLGVLWRVAEAKATRLRKKGVKLKRFAIDRRAVDVDALKQLAASLAE